MKNTFYTLIYVSFFSVNLSAQIMNDSLLKKLKSQIKEELSIEMKNELKTEKNSATDISKFSLHGYSVVNYYNYDFDTDPAKKNKVDAERLNIYPEYIVNDWIAIKSEIEFEYGGTGASIGFDNQQEFGEFEKEIEKGGSVKLEQIHVDFSVNPWLNLKVGRLKLLFNLAQSLDDPNEYFTPYRQEMENEIFPLGWYEVGVAAYGTFAKRFNYVLSVTNGLDSSGFNSRGWIRDGHQERFEMPNANAFALMSRLDYKFGKHHNTYFGFSAYVGDSAANRPKEDLKKSAYVTILEGHFTYNEFPLRIASTAVYGNLENSNIVSARNAGLSNELGVKRTPVGKNAIAFSTEIGYDILHLIKPLAKQMLYPFIRYEFYDTMAKVEGNIIDNPRWERSVITGGFNWFITDEINIKAAYANRKLGSLNYNLSTLEYTGNRQKENTFSLGIGFEF